MKKIFFTHNSKQTQKLGEALSLELRSGKVICLSGDLGSGKTTFSQGLLKGLKVKGPYISPTFLIIKHYHGTHSIKHKTENKRMFHDIYHIDAYRVKAKDLLDLGWKEMIKNPNNVIIIEWADRIKKIIPPEALWIKFEWLDADKRKIIFKP